MHQIQFQRLSIIYLNMDADTFAMLTCFAFHFVMFLIKWPGWGVVSAWLHIFHWIAIYSLQNRIWLGEVLACIVVNRCSSHMVVTLLWYSPLIIAIICPHCRLRFRVKIQRSYVSHYSYCCFSLLTRHWLYQRGYQVKTENEISENGLLDHKLLCDQ